CSVSRRCRASSRARGRLAGGEEPRALDPRPSRRDRVCSRVLRRRLGRPARMSDLFSLDGRVAIVTGGSGQIGREVVRGLQERGARVAVFDLLADPFSVDVKDRAAIEAATEQVAREWGEPHVLVNAAALDSPPDAPPEEVGPLESYPEASFDE